MANYAKENFKKVFEGNREFKSGNYKEALTCTLLELDKNLKSKPYAMDAGTTACVVFITSDKIYCANSGDSRAVLCNNKKAVALSEDHKPNNHGEKLRI